MSNINKVLFILLLGLSIISCNAEFDIDSECKIDKDCSRRGENYVCTNNRCEYSFCKSLKGDIACGDGDCFNMENGYYCNCIDEDYSIVYTNYTENNDAYNYQFKYRTAKCVKDNYCNRAKDCIGLSRNNESLGVCSTDNQCISTCEIDFDCFGEYTKCNNEYDNFCYDMKDIFLEHKDEYCKDGFFNPYTDNYCGRYCNSTTDCKIGLICNLENMCVPMCTKDDDCKKDKFAKGNSCDVNLNYCVAR